MDTVVFLVKAELLLHEEMFDKLRDFVKKIDTSKLNSFIFYVLDYPNENNNDLGYSTADFCFYYKTKDLISEYIVKGYILISFSTLKQHFLSL